MDASTALREMRVLHASHTVRQSEFQVPSAVLAGHLLSVRRLDSNAQAVTQSDLHFLMYADVAPGCSAVLRNHTGRPPNRFGVYMSIEAISPVVAALAAPKALERARSIG